MVNTKKFYFREDKPPITYRPGTSDESIIQTVLVEGKEYAFPKFKPKVVYDIGGNIGVLAVLLANLYPDSRIYSFEPVKENLELLKENAQHYKNITVCPYGLGESSRKELIHKSTDPTNFGGFSHHIKDGSASEEIEIVDINDITGNTGLPDLIKIDCEGAEYEILGSYRHLDKVRWITGELHGVDQYELLGLLDHDFHLSFARNFDDKVWHFQALSKGNNILDQSANSDL